MSKLQILRFPHPFLRNKAQPIKSLAPELVQLSRDMLQLMYESQGVGLAAVQVGKPVALLTADTRLDFQNPYYQPEPLSLASKENRVSRYERESLNCSLEVKIKQPLILFNPKVVKKQGEVIFRKDVLVFLPITLK